MSDKALDILDEIGSKFNLLNKKRKIDESDINDIFKSILGLSIFNFKEYDKNFLIGA